MCAGRERSKRRRPTRVDGRARPAGDRDLARSAHRRRRSGGSLDHLHGRIRAQRRLGLGQHLVPPAARCSLRPDRLGDSAALHRSRVPRHLPPGERRARASDIDAGVPARRPCRGHQPRLARALAPGGVVHRAPIRTGVVVAHRRGRGPGDPPARRRRRRERGQRHRGELLPARSRGSAPPAERRQGRGRGGRHRGRHGHVHKADGGASGGSPHARRPPDWRPRRARSAMRCLACAVDGVWCVLVSEELVGRRLSNPGHAPAAVPTRVVSHR